MGRKKKKKAPQQQPAEAAVAAVAEAAAASDDSEAPEDYICPITQELLRDPVIIASCGHTFERNNITEWSLSLLSLSPSLSARTIKQTHTHPYTRMHTAPLCCRLENQSTCPSCNRDLGPRPGRLAQLTSVYALKAIVARFSEERPQRRRQRRERKDLVTAAQLLAGQAAANDADTLARATRRDDGGVASLLASLDLTQYDTPHAREDECTNRKMQAHVE